MKVRFSPRSRDDLAGILTYIDGHSPTGARTVREAFRRSLRLIGDVPDIGALVEGGIRCVPIPRHPYVIYYVVGDNAADILHVRHAARDRPTF